jgi:hypothetical protein
MQSIGMVFLLVHQTETGVLENFIALQTHSLVTICQSMAILKALLAHLLIERLFAQLIDNSQV